MVIALLAVLGVNLIVLVAFAAIVNTRKRWVKRQPGAFRGSIKVASGEIDGISPKSGRGYGHWVRDVLVWAEAPLRFRNELVRTDRLDDRGVVAAAFPGSRRAGVLDRCRARRVGLHRRVRGRPAVRNAVAAGHRRDHDLHRRGRRSA